ncbi:sigma-70 family RNA polymerase sigma factor [Lentzea sp. NEAU-D13]|uniref:Sigma-70 family RNA polymerase sigma factor n=1 Tax=Lentzea alba TaxID=2714351 RepID=A0A7C9RV85_9PSEU|nr:sigma-70 family RNA polymerase sigma factor [Lentzea alba]NGY63750.1 sigma-70 family RNA polymerase sigma factor [Lentzea alba]
MTIVHEKGVVDAIGAPGDREARQAVVFQNCRSGVEGAWNSVVEEFTPIVWSVAKSFGLLPDDCADICQSTWAHAVRSIDRIRHPARFRTWIVTVAKRESIKLRQFTARHVPVADVESGVTGADLCGPEEVAVERADHLRVRVALSQLPSLHQELLWMLISDPPPSYDEISRTLHIPRGSIGPTRARALQRMRELLEEDSPATEFRVA